MIPPCFIRKAEIGETFAIRLRMSWFARFIRRCLFLRRSIVSSRFSVAPGHWILSQNVTFHMRGRSFGVPGYMVWCALLYAGTASWLSWRVGRPLIQLNSERLIPCVEHDLSKGCGADDRGDAEAQQQEFSPLGRGQQDATHDQHLRREAQCCYQRRRCRGHVGLLIGSICHGVNPADGGNDLRPAICQKRSASCKTPIMKKQIG